MKKLVALVALTIAIFASSMILAVWPDGRPILMDAEITLLPMPLEWSSSAYITIGIRSGMKSMTLIVAEGVMTLVANRLPLPNVVSVGITFITSPLMASAVAVSAVFAVVYAVFHSKGPPWRLALAKVAKKLNRNCLITCLRRSSLKVLFYASGQGFTSIIP